MLTENFEGLRVQEVHKWNSAEMSSRRKRRDKTMGKRKSDSLNNDQALKNKKWDNVLTLILLSILLLWVFITQLMAAEVPVLAEIEEAADLAVDYISKSCGKDGRFVYLFDLSKNKPLNAGYNLLRHGGTMYSLSMYDRWKSSSAVQNVMKRAGTFLLKNCLEEVPGQDNTIAIMSRPEIVFIREKQAKLGGTGLGLVALCSIERFEPGFTDLETLRGLGNFILFMQKKDGSFYSKYFPQGDGRNDAWTSLYYPGEAALGLMYLYEIDPDEKWFEGAVKTLEYLSNLREGDWVVEADHWALLASAKVIPKLTGPDRESLRKKLEVHVHQICRRILFEWRLTRSVPFSPKGFTPDGRSAPCATRLEGLQAALSLAAMADHSQRKTIRKAVDESIVSLSRGQIKTGSNRGAVPATMKKFPFYHPLSWFGFNENRSLVRIDYPQHALSAFVMYCQEQ